MEPVTFLTDLSHSFFECSHSREAVDELAAVYTTATGLMHIWEARVHRKQITPFLVRAELEAKISLLRRTRYSGAGTRMQEILGE